MQLAALCMPFALLRRATGCARIRKACCSNHGTTMRQRKGTTERRGALMVEAAFVHPIMLILIFMIIIGGMGVFRYQQVACQAREAARWAAVRGSDWHAQTGEPFPTKSDILKKAVLPMAAGMDQKSLSLQVEWIDEVNGKGKAEDCDSAAKHP